MTNNIDLKACRLQGDIFEKSVIYLDCGSATFIRNFMNSKIASHIDKGTIMQESISLDKIFNSYKEEYGDKKYGSIQFKPQAMFWIGYLYRYWCEMYRISSKSVYKIINGSELNSLYLSYHTFSPEKAIKRIQESKNDNQSDNYLISVMKRIYL